MRTGSAEAVGSAGADGSQGLISLGGWKEGRARERRINGGV